MSHLAILGGEKIRTKLFPGYQVIGSEEEDSVRKVLNSGVLSKFIGVWCKDFYGGTEVRALEKEWAEMVGVKHAISVNSATSGLYAAVGAGRVGPGDEVIVSPYTMAASATAPLIFNAVPVFADIEKEYFCIDPDEFEKKITPRTKAIIVVDIFGQPYDAARINAIARKHGILVIEDAAQAPGAKYNGKWAGTLGDIGVYSLNYHKHIHSGEGGIVVTDNDELADRVRMIRNHAEAVALGRDMPNLENMVGFNFRMTEIEAAIARAQLKKLPGLLKQRQDNVKYLSEKLSGIPCLEPAKIREGCEHSFYVHPVSFNPDAAGVRRETFINAVKAELMPSELREDDGVLISCGYVKPLYLLPIYQKQIAYGSQGCPFKCPLYKGKVDYSKGVCPVCEEYHFEKLITHELMRPPITHKDLDEVFNAFAKVWEYRGELKDVR